MISPREQGFLPHVRRTFLVGLIGLSLAACASAAPASGQRFAGTWDWRFETSSFVTDDGQGPWWLSADGPTWEQVAAPLTQSGRGPWGRVRLVVEGRLSAPGRYGHLGAYEREFRVTRVIEATLTAAEPQ